MKTEKVNVWDLKHAEYNPRKISDDKFREIKNSLSKFGLVQPLVVNRAKGRENIIIGGNQRFEVLKALKYEHADVLYVDIPDLEREKELNIRLNRNQGQWDFDILKKEFKAEDLLDYGFIESELPAIEGGEKKPETDQSVVGDQMKIYLNNPIKQIVLYFEEKDFKKTIDKLDKLCEQRKFAGYPELVWHLIFGEELLP